MSVPFGPVNVAISSRRDAPRRRPRRRRGRSPSAPTDARRGSEPPGWLPGTYSNGPVLGADVGEVHERLQEVLVVEVDVPVLRGDALVVAGCWRRVPEVDVRELRPEAEVRVRDVEHAGARRTRRTTASSAASVAPSKLCARTTNSLPARTLPCRPAAIVRSVSATNAAPCASMPLPRLLVDELGERQRHVALTVERVDDARAASRRARAGASVERLPALRFPSSRSWSSYVATIPRRSTAEATRLTRLASFVRWRCIDAGG